MAYALDFLEVVASAALYLIAFVLPVAILLWSWQISQDPKKAQVTIFFLSMALLPLAARHFLGWSLGSSGD